MSRVIMLPKSAVHGAMALVGLVAFVTGLIGARVLAPWHYEWQACLAVMAWVALLLLGTDLLFNRVYRRPSTGLDPAHHDPSLRRTLVKLLGLVGTLALLDLGYMGFPVYSDPLYGPFFSMLPWLLPVWLTAALPYFYLVDRRMREPHDGYWQMGQVLLLQWGTVDRRVFGQHLLGWLVKGFFLPLMFGYLCQDMAKLLGYDGAAVSGGKPLYDAAFTAMYFADVALVSVGYLVTFRLTDTHIRSTEPTLLGWAVALACYQPFWGMVSGNFLAYRTDYDWERWLAPLPVLYLAWGAVILLLTAIYLWATLSFAGRFSNLTHRGILTNGPYRFTKHPAYLAKNLSWWLISVPFLAQGGWWEGVLRCLMLFGVNVLYWLRARTEERHLSADPVYVQYALWMEQHGLLRRVVQLKGLGLLRYKVPEA
ncbi:MAG TPA: isoprenylcysteine carboxylmethyltransferase family protein [Gammaproteobacteria bacterium]|jgi:protein-S-isoprenylcysteine O-methyltransferase Ste14